MLRIETLAPHVVHFDLSGIITADDIRAMGDALEPMLAGGGDVAMLADAVGVEDITGKAVAEDLKLEVKMIRYWTRFSRVALVTDKQWIRNLTKASSHLVPRSDIRLFTPDQMEAAREFVMGASADRATAQPAIRMIDSPDEDIIAFEIDGVVTREDAEQMFKVFETRKGEGRKVNMLMRLRHYGGFDPAMMLNAPFWSMKLAALRNTGRCALVGGPQWMQSAAGFAAPLTNIEVRRFAAEEEPAAWEWLREPLKGS
jgi:hypothetical protein